MPIGLHEY